MKEMIARFDEVISDKVNKNALEQLETRLNITFYTKKAVENEV